jgi:hypothetical protein
MQYQYSMGLASELSFGRRDGWPFVLAAFLFFCFSLLKRIVQAVARGYTTRKKVSLLFFSFLF